ncbi:MAG: TM0106 family RecB-like putative nuclease [archaeon]|nr:TM0106 family RecB-like putative nuclease [archaeon]MCP8320735.1 TM0106 family RecB-like putative nuclease [archaeon]
MKKKKSLTEIHGIGRVKSEKLRRIGIKNIEDLIDIKDLEEVSIKTGFSEGMLRKIQLQCKSVLERKIYQIAPFALPKDVIFYDIETDLAWNRVWMIGVLKDGMFTQYYADQWSEEKKILKDFLSFLKKHPKSTLVSFSGIGFDQFVLQRALHRLRLDSRCFPIRPHIDLYQSLRGSFLFPISSYSLKELGKFLNYRFNHPELDGFNVALAYGRHVEEKEPLDSRLLEYNEDDVKVLPFIVEKLSNEKHRINREYMRKSRFASEEFLDVKELIKIIRDAYDKCGRIIIKRTMGKYWNVEIRFQTYALEDLDLLRDSMASLGFVEGIVWKGGRRFYLPYYGKQQLMRFVSTIKPEGSARVDMIVKDMIFHI